MNRVIIPLSKEKPFEEQPLTYKKVKISNGFTAMVQCINNHAGLIDNHDIDINGIVSPSVVCTQDNCTWHEFIQLLDW
jgi:hypothetical protein